MHMTLLYDSLIRLKYSEYAILCIIVMLYTVETKMAWKPSFDQLRLKHPSYEDPFIVQWEIPNPREGGAARMYGVFDGIGSYISYLTKGRYNTCHEVFVSSSFNVSEEFMGRPVFDIDIHLGEGEVLPPNWTILLQMDIEYVLGIQYPEVQMSTYLSGYTKSNPWVWMTSKSIGKISKHLVLGTIAFATWRSQMKLLLAGLKGLKDKKSPDVVIAALDDAITRKLGSLRLPMNSKVSNLNAPITFDDSTHTFVDGIVMMHSEVRCSLSGGKVLTFDDLSPEYQPKYIYVPPSLDISHADEGTDMDESEMNRYIAIFEKLNKLYSCNLVVAKVSGSIVHLKRTAPGKCLISGKVHDSDNAYLFTKGSYVYYACHRGCKAQFGGNERGCIRITDPSLDIKESIINECKRYTTKNVPMNT